MKKIKKLLEVLPNTPFRSPLNAKTAINMLPVDVYAKTTLLNNWSQRLPEYKRERYACPHDLLDDLLYSWHPDTINRVFADYINHKAKCVPMVMPDYITFEECMTLISSMFLDINQPTFIEAMQENQEGLVQLMKTDSSGSIYRSTIVFQVCRELLVNTTYDSIELL